MNLKEHVVPFSFEQSPTKLPSTPGFTAQPYQNNPPQYSRVQPFAPTGKIEFCIKKLLIEDKHFC